MAYGPLQITSAHEYALLSLRELGWRLWGYYVRRRETRTTAAMTSFAIYANAFSSKPWDYVRLMKFFGVLTGPVDKPVKNAKVEARQIIEHHVSLGLLPVSVLENKRW